jgi:hypothetical protein
VIEVHDTLIVNPRIELIGEEAAVVTDFIVHMLDLQLKRQLAVPRSGSIRRSTCGRGAGRVDRRTKARGHRRRHARAAETGTAS